MGLAEDLLAQSRHLALLDAKRPKQANLRRAVSSAYYALFHLLIAEAVHSLVPHGPLTDRVSRAFQHGEMKEVCDQIGRTPTPAKFIELLGAEASPQLRSVTRIFLLLQEERHAADYDVSLRLSRTDTLALIASAEQAFQNIAFIGGSQEAVVFFAALAFAKRWDRNR